MGKARTIERARTEAQPGFEYHKVIKLNKRAAIDVTHICGKRQIVFWGSHLSKRRGMGVCKYCKKIRTIDQIKKIGSKDYLYHAIYKIKCGHIISMTNLICGHSFCARWKTHTKRPFCRICISEAPKNIFFASLMGYPKNFDYLKVSLSEQLFIGDRRSWKIKMRCLRCWRINIREWERHFIYSNCCKYCTASKGEDAIANFLLKNKIKSYRQAEVQHMVYLLNLKTELNRGIDLCRYDFYLPEQNMIIEFNGAQHYKYSDFFHNYNPSRFEYAKRIDIMKKRFITGNNIKFVEISYLDFKQIDSILEGLLL